MSQPPISSAAMRGPSVRANISPATVPRVTSAERFCGRASLGKRFGAETPGAQPFAQCRADHAISRGKCGDLSVKIGWGGDEPARSPTRDAGRAAQQHRHCYTDGDRSALATDGSRQRADHAIEPAGGEQVIGTAFHAVLSLEMAAHPIRTGNGVHRQKVARGIDGVQVFERGVQAEEAAQVQHAVRVSRSRRGYLGTQSGKRRITVQESPPPARPSRRAE